MFKINCTVWKYGQFERVVNTFEEANQLIKNCKNWLKKAKENTYMCIDISNLDTAQVLRAWSNIPTLKLKLNLQNGNTAEPLVVPH